MNVILTGGTGYIGSAVLRELLAHGHAVTALVRSDSAAEAVRAAGATPAVGDLFDVAWLTEQLRGADALIHTAATGDERSPQLDGGVVDAVAAAGVLVHVHTGGVWVHGDGDAITEETPFAAPAIVAWRQEIEERALASQTARTVIIEPAIVYGHRKGITRLLAEGPRDASGALELIGSGDQRWGTVHVDDVADLYVRALEHDTARGRYLAAPTAHTVREIGLAVADEVAPSTREATEARLGAPFAEALLLDQNVATTRAQDELGWSPSRPTLVQELQAERVAA
jgi:nucleoside-diphosphate-sugar epimerase